MLFCDFSNVFMNVYHLKDAIHILSKGLCEYYLATLTSRQVSRCAEPRSVAEHVLSLHTLLGCPGTLLVRPLPF